MSNPNELPDLDLNELEAIALAATPGPWKGDRYDGTIKYDLLGKDDETVIHGDNGNSDHGPFGIENEEDANYLLAFHPATALRLIELARRAQPEGEAPQAEPGAWVNKVKAAMKRAEIGTGSRGRNYDGNRLAWLLEDILADAVAAPEAAQHAESGAQACGSYECRAGQHDGILCGEDGCDIALGVRAAQSQGAQDEDPIGDFQAVARQQKLNDFVRAAKQAAAPGALLEILRDVHDTLASESDSDIDHFEDDDEEREGAPVQYAARKVMEVMDMLKAAPSAPGTPEAPSQLMQALTNGIPLKEPVSIGKALWAQREARAVLSGGTGPVAAVHLVNIGLTGWVHTKETAEAWADGYNTALKQYRSVLRMLAAPQRAAQLDGGQGEGLKRCAAGRDGECRHKGCPQLRDNEPAKSGRHCPLDEEGSESNG